MLLKFLKKAAPESVAIVPDDVPEPIAAPAPDARPVDQLDLSTRTRNALHKAGINTIEQLREFENPTEIPGLGAKSADEIASALAKFQTPPDQLPLTFKGLILVIGEGDVHAPRGWKYVDMNTTFGPVRDGIELCQRLKHLTQYAHLMAHIVSCEDVEGVLQFADRNKVPVIVCS